MNRTASHVLKDVDVVLLVTDKFDWDNETIQIFDKIKRTNKVFIWVINKIDKIKKNIEEVNAMYENMLDKTTKSLENIIKNADTASNIQ